MPFKNREKYNEYMRTYKQNRWEEITQLLDLFRGGKEFHVFIRENPLRIDTIRVRGLETFLKNAPKAGLDPKKMQHFHVKLIESEELKT